MSNNIFIITAPSGAGKTTLIKKALSHAKEIGEQVYLIVSHTTREPRKGEEHGKDYCFVTEEQDIMKWIFLNLLSHSCIKKLSNKKAVLLYMKKN